MGKDFIRGKPIEAFARSAVEGINKGLDDSVGDSGYIRMLGYTLPEKAVGILIGAPLPGGIWVGKEEGHMIQRPGDLTVGSEFTSPIRGHCSDFVSRERRQKLYHLAADNVCAGVWHFCGQQEAGAPVC